MNDDYTDRRFIARRHPMTRGKDLAAAVKVLRCLAAGFQRLEHRGLEWAPVAGIQEDPYYVCARFANGRHIPGPILAYRAHQRGVQGWVVRLAMALRVPAAVEARAAWKAYADAYTAFWAALDAAERDAADGDDDAYDAADAQHDAVCARVVGRTWGTEVTAAELPGFDPVISQKGRILDVVPSSPALSPAEAASERSCFWDEERQAFVANWALGDILQVYLSYDDADWDAALALASKWIAAGFDDRQAIPWLNARVADPDQASALRAAGLGPDDLPVWMLGWRSPAQIQRILDRAAASKAR